MLTRQLPFTRRLTLKRCIDVVVAAALLVSTAPLLAVCGLIVWLDDGRPLLFTQVRCGLGGRRFRIVKLRTLRLDAGSPEELGQVWATSPGVTRSGRFLRRYKLDEFPQLWNILRGEMSLVGPRPTLPEQVEAYSDVQLVRLDVLPGLTGIAQVSGGTLLTWDDRICLDIWYVDHRSFRLDLLIITKTFEAMFRGEGRNEALVRRAQAHLANIAGWTRLSESQDPTRSVTLMDSAISPNSTYSVGTDVRSPSRIDRAGPPCA